MRLLLLVVVVVAINMLEEGEQEDIFHKTIKYCLLQVTLLSLVLVLPGIHLTPTLQVMEEILALLDIRLLVEVEELG
tara:strand:- start:851 stop:1081 length:231 start_codon:yes stop_codon:yes gene_type:complete